MRDAPAPAFDFLAPGDASSGSLAAGPGTATYRIQELEPGDIAIGSGESTTLELPASNVLDLLARIDFQTMAGDSRALRVQVNGQTIVKPPLNKAVRFRYLDLRDYPYQISDAWSLFYSPDFSQNNEAPPPPDLVFPQYVVVTDPGQAYRFTWDIGSLTAGKPTMTVRFENVNNNKMVIHLGPTIRDLWVSKIDARERPYRYTIAVRTEPSLFGDETAQIVPEEIRVASMSVPFQQLGAATPLGGKVSGMYQVEVQLLNTTHVDELAFDVTIKDRAGRSGGRRGKLAGKLRIDPAEPQRTVQSLGNKNNSVFYPACGDTKDVRALFAFMSDHAIDLAGGRYFIRKFGDPLNRKFSKEVEFTAMANRLVPLTFEGWDGRDMGGNLAPTGRYTLDADVDGYQRILSAHPGLPVVKMSCFAPYDDPTWTQRTPKAFSSMQAFHHAVTGHFMRMTDSDIKNGKHGHYFWLYDMGLFVATPSYDWIPPSAKANPRKLANYKAMDANKRWMYDANYNFELTAEWARREPAIPNFIYRLADAIDTASDTIACGDGKNQGEFAQCAAVVFPWLIRWVAYRNASDGTFYPADRPQGAYENDVRAGKYDK